MTVPNNLMLVSSQQEFIVEWNINDGDYIYQPLRSNYTYNYQIDWGDGTIQDVISYNSEYSGHTYIIGGVYDIKIKGVCPYLDYGNYIYSIKNKIIKVKSWGSVKFDYINFENCINLIELPNESGKLKNVTDFSRFCYKCPISNIPDGLFKGNINVGSISQCFQYCNLISIPSELFSDNISVTNFSSCFRSNDIINIPSGLFDNNTSVTDFSYCFFNNDIINIPSGLFDNNTSVTNFSSCFYKNLLTGITDNIFDNCYKVINFSYIFYNCELTSYPSGLFDNCPNVTNFSNAFRFNDNILNSVDELWNDFPSANGTYCFNGCVNATNYASIPTDWK